VWQSDVSLHASSHASLQPSDGQQCTGKSDVVPKEESVIKIQYRKRISHLRRIEHTNKSETKSADMEELGHRFLPQTARVTT